ncbi:MAG: DNA polymerase III subunit delta [Candidatus Saccharimonadales bacterium]
MITLIYGENAYERDQQLATMLADIDASERHEGERLTTADIPQLLQGLSLFSAQHTPVITQLGDNKPVWTALGEYLETIDMETVSLILVEAKPDKRTKTFKTLQKKARLIECKPFGERDTTKAAAWLEAYAAAQNISLERPAANELVRRLGVDQYTLLHEVQRLSSLGSITLSTVQSYTEETTHDTAFDLLTLALKGETGKVQQKIYHLQASEDAYMTLGLLVSQLYALAGSVTGGGEAVAAELGVHPFVLSRLQTVARTSTEATVRYAINELALVDMQLKSSSNDPWLAIEIALTNIAERAAH